MGASGEAQTWLTEGPPCIEDFGAESPPLIEDCYGVDAMADMTEAPYCLMRWLLSP